MNRFGTIFVWLLLLMNTIMVVWVFFPLGTYLLDRGENNYHIAAGYGYYVFGAGWFLYVLYKCNLMFDLFKED